MYHFPEKLNYDGFFRFDKRLIENMNIAALPDSSKAIYPVILSFCDENGVSFPSYQTIADLTGLSLRTVQNGVKGLQGFPDLQITEYITRKGREGKKYIWTPSQELIAKVEGRCFFFHRHILEAGNWRMLDKNVSAGLYLAMRYFGYFDQDLYYEIEYGDDPSYSDDIKELYKIRKWDICEAEISVLARYAGISRPSVYKGLKDLTECCLIEEMPLEYDLVRRWKVFITPATIYKRSFLNGALKKSRCKNPATIRKKPADTRVKHLPEGVKKVSCDKGGSC